MSRLLSICLLFFLSCSANKKRITSDDGKHLIAILPFSGVDTSLSRDLKKELETRLFAEISILPQHRLPSSAFFKPRHRYVADSLLDYLAAFNNEKFEKIIGLTGDDISTRKGTVANWGIMGLAKNPGDVCVISSFRPRTSMKDRDHLIRRMTILSLHELGHAYSLPHCSGKWPCIMKDAEGKMNLDNAASYCNRCRSFLEKEKVLRTEYDFSLLTASD